MQVSLSRGISPDKRQWWDVLKLLPFLIERTLISRDIEESL